MTLQQYTRNLRGICKDGSSPDQVALGGYFERVVRYEWQVEERRYMQHVCEGWLYKTSRSMVNASPRRMYRWLVLSTPLDPLPSSPLPYLSVSPLPPYLVPRNSPG